MTMRGVEKPGALTVSSAFTGAFKDDRALRTEFFAAVRGGGGR
jgi:GTP cyclohydrolase I